MPVRINRCRASSKPIDEAAWLARVPSVAVTTGLGYVFIRESRAASIAKLALGITSHPGPDGKLTVSTPLSIQNRRISAGAIKLGQMPELKLN